MTMTFNGRIALLMPALLLLASCAVLNRGLSVSTDRPDLTAEELSAIHAPEGELLDVISTNSLTTGPSHRRMLVYLPEAYRADSLRRYPVLYIIHGARGNETSWIKDGNILRSTDSLLRAGLVEPFIIVMPNMNQYKDDKDYGESRFKKPIEGIFDTDGTVETAFVHDVVGTVDSLFRTIPDKEHRAIAGLSVGGLQSIFISANHPDTFDAIGLFSPMHYGPVKKSPYSDFYKKRNSKQEVQFRNPPRLYSIYIGSRDIFYMDVEQFRADLQHKGFPFQYSEIPGGHEWKCWQQFYVMFAQDCFGK